MPDVWRPSRRLGVILTYTAVPESGSLALLGAATAAAAWRVRRRPSR